MAKRLTERGERQLIERTALTVADYARHWLTAIAPAKAAGKTSERYGELIEKHIVPRMCHTTPEAGRLAHRQVLRHAGDQQSP